MRIVRLKLPAEVPPLLKAITMQFSIDDPGFTEDIFALLYLKGHGLPDKARIGKLSQALAKKYKRTAVGLNLLISKRKMVLHTLVSQPYFRALCKREDLVSATERLLTTFGMLYRKTRSAQCISCHLMPNCQFGKQYGKVMQDITKVIDPDYKKKAHKDCPSLPEISAMNRLFDAMKTFQQLTAATPGAEALREVAGPTNPQGDEPPDIAGLSAPVPEVQEDEELDVAVSEDPDKHENFLPHTGMGYSRTNAYDGRHTGMHIAKVAEQLVANVSVAQLAIYELGKKFSLALEGQDAKSFKPEQAVSQDQTQKHIDSMADITRVVSSAHGLPEEVFNARLERKQLDKQQFVKPEEKRKLLHVLIDSSGSMGGWLGNHGHMGNPSNGMISLFTRGSLSTVMTLALIEKMRKDKGIIYVRFFGGAPGNLMKAETGDEYEQLKLLVARNSYCAGGTNITRAVQTAVDDIVNAEKASPLAGAEILCITDCEDSVSEVALKEASAKREFNILDVSGSSRTAHKALKNAATKYMKVNESAPDINALVQTVV